MSEEKKLGRRPQTRFWVWAEHWLLGSTRTELTNEERAVFMDFLCLTSLRGGCIEVFSRDQLASQLLITRELLDQCIEKFLKTGKITRKYRKREKKEILCPEKWEQYQPEYLWKNPERSTRKSRGEKMPKNEAHVAGIGEERRTEENGGKENGRSEDKKNENHPKTSPKNSPLPSSPTKKEEFLLLLKECKGYPFDEFKDSILFDTTVSSYPKINILEQLRRKIEWWRTHPDALKADTRKQLQNFFSEEDRFQKRRGPQPIGNILQELKDPDQRNWLTQFLQK